MTYSAGILLNGCIFATLLIPVDFWTPPSRRTNLTKRTLKDIMSVSVLKDPNLYFFFLNKVTWNLGSFTIWTFVVDYARESGMNKDSAAAVVSVITGCSIGTRALLSFLMTVAPKLHPVHIYNISSTAAGLLALLLPLHSSLAMFWVIVTLFGVCFGGMNGSLGITAIRLFGVEHSTSAFCYAIMGSGIGAFFGPPVAGKWYILDVLVRIELMQFLKFLLCFWLAWPSSFWHALTNLQVPFMKPLRITSCRSTLVGAVWQSQD